MNARQDGPLAQRLMSDKTQSPTPDSSATADPRRKRSWHGRLVRLLLWSLVVVVLLVGVSLWIVTRSWFIIAQVQPELQRRVGGPVNIAEATYVGDGKFVFRGVVVHAPGYSGAAGRVGQIDRVELRLDPARLLDGSKAVQSLLLDGVHLRLSEDAQNPGRFSFMALQPDWSSDADDESVTVLPPSIEIRDLQLELGTYDGDEYTRIGLRRLAGQMYPSTEDERLYNFELGEVDEDGRGVGELGLRVKGDWNVVTNEHSSRLDGLTLDKQTYNMCPQLARVWWDRMQLEGRVDGVTLHWKRDEPVTVAMGVEDVGLTIPVETNEIWARYRAGKVEPTPSRMRMRVKAGTIRLEGDHLTLDNLQGELGAVNAASDVVGVPYTVRLDIPELPRLQWQNRAEFFDEALKRAPFHMTFAMEDFRVQQDDIAQQPAVDLPRVVAEALERFAMQDWVLETKVEISRDPPVRGPGGELIAQQEVWSGQAFINDASCRYENFAYPLDDVDAYLEFDRDAVKLVYLYGYGSERTRIRLSGEIAPPSNQAAVNLKLTAQGLPIDDRLRDALDPAQVRVYDALLHAPSMRGLQAAGLLTDEQDIKSLQQRRDQLVHELSQRRSALVNDQQPADVIEQAIREVQPELARLDRIIEAGPFNLGGHVDIDLDISREYGSDQPTFVTGTMAIRDGGLLYESFPYPMNITGGVIHWHERHISIGNGDDDAGLRFVTPSGGLGYVTGEIRFPPADAPVEPQLQIEVVDDRISESVLAAIPPADSERIEMAEQGGAAGPPAPPWPGAMRSTVSSVLGELGLTGGLDFEGRIDLDAQGNVNYDFAVAVSNGRAEPGSGASQLVGESGLFWPADFQVQDIEALLRVSRDSIELYRFNGEHSEGGQVTGGGYRNVAAEPDTMRLTVTLADLPIGEYLLDVAPREGVSKARELWQRYTPDGRFDATFVYADERAGVTGPELQLQPKSVQAHVGGSTVEFKRQRGQMWLRDNQVQFDDLQLALIADGVPQGDLTLNGVYGVQESEQNLELLGKWNDGRLESPLITEAMRLIGAESEADEFDALDPSGTFGASFVYRSPQSNRPSDFALSLQPREVALTIHDTVVRATIDQGGTIEVHPGAIHVTEFSGMLGEGRFTATGGVEQIDGATTVDLHMDFDGRLSDPQVQAVLPQTARDALWAIEFSDGPGSTLRGGRLFLQQVPAGQDSDADTVGWRTMFRSVVQTDEASFKGGVEFERINGRFDIALRTAPDAPPELSILVDEASIRTLGNTMTGASATIRLEPNDLLAVRDFRADLHGGVVTAGARFGIGERRDYEATVSMAGVLTEGLLAGEESESDDGTFVRSAASARSGDVFARLTLQGERGRPDAQTGRGSVRMAQGRIARMPIMMAVLHVLELMPPLSDSLNFGDISFYVEGETAVLDHILLECPTLKLNGSGTVNLETMDMDVLFRSRNKMMLVGDMIGEVSDQLFGIRVRGPITDPAAELVPLPGLSQPSGSSKTMTVLSEQRDAAAID